MRSSSCARPAVGAGPENCISYGACGNSAAVSSMICSRLGAYDGHRTGGCAAIPGACQRLPPRCNGFAMALGLLEQKIHARAPGELDDQPAEILHPDMVQPLRVKVDRGRAGWRVIAMVVRSPMITWTQLAGEQQVARWLKRKNDPAFNRNCHPSQS